MGEDIGDDQLPLTITGQKARPKCQPPAHIRGRHIAQRRQIHSLAAMRLQEIQKIADVIRVSLDGQRRQTPHMHHLLPPSLKRRGAFHLNRSARRCAKRKKRKLNHQGHQEHQDAQPCCTSTRARNAHSSTAIEGNPLTLEQVLAPARSLAEFIALAKDKPGALSYGTPGIGTSPHLSMELLKSMAGIDIQHVPYRGTAAAVTDVIGGQIAATFANALTAKPQVDHTSIPLMDEGELPDVE